MLVSSSLVIIALYSDKEQIKISLASRCRMSSEDASSIVGCTHGVTKRFAYAREVNIAVPSHAAFEVCSYQKRRSVSLASILGESNEIEAAVGCLVSRDCVVISIQRKHPRPLSIALRVNLHKIRIVTCGREAGGVSRDYETAVARLCDTVSDI